MNNRVYKARQLRRALQLWASTLEDESLTLEKSLKLYEEGVKLASKCSLELDAAERKIKLLQRNSEGEIVETPITEDDLA